MKFIFYLILLLWCVTSSLYAMIRRHEYGLEVFIPFSFLMFIQLSDIMQSFSFYLLIEDKTFLW